MSTYVHRNSIPASWGFITMTSKSSQGLGICCPARSCAPNVVCLLAAFASNLSSVFNKMFCLFTAPRTYIIFCSLSCKFCYLGHCWHVFPLILHAATQIFAPLVFTLLTYLHKTHMWLCHSVTRYLNSGIDYTISVDCIRFKANSFYPDYCNYNL